VGLLVFTLVSLNRDDFMFSDSDYDEEIETRDSADYEHGVAYVTLESRDQVAAGIEVVAVKEANHQIDYLLYGVVVSLSELLEIQDKLVQLMNESRINALEENHLAESYERARILYEERQIISLRELKKAEFLLGAIKADRLNLDRALRSLNNSADAKWGKKISEWVFSEKSRELGALLDQKASLVRLYVSDIKLSDMDIEAVDVAPVAAPGRKLSARFISDAPSVKLGTGGADKFFIVEAGMPTGTQVVASLSKSSKGTDGVFVPNESVLWHSGRPWVFKNINDGVFARVEIKADVDLGAGWFEVNTLVPGDQIVVTGAQLLLSEELKYQIRNENED
jgi:hypothetical protein